jgi:hypothetical protein
MKQQLGQLVCSDFSAVVQCTACMLRAQQHTFMVAAEECMQNCARDLCLQDQLVTIHNSTPSTAEKTLSTQAPRLCALG